MAGGHDTGSVGSVASAGRGGEGRSTVGAAAASSFATWWRRGIRNAGVTDSSSLGTEIGSGQLFTRRACRGDTEALSPTCCSLTPSVPKVIEADTIDEAAEEILKALKEGTDATSRDNAVYLDGWDGLGASAVLRAVAQRLVGASPANHHGRSAQAGLEFEQVIHIDCSMWESRRALQRAAAEQLRLPAEAMAMLDRQDKEDDFHGVALGSRVEVQQVATEIYRHVQKLSRRFLVIFHNGSSEVMDLASVCGLPLSGYSTSKVLWTFQGRFRLKPRTKVDAAVGSTTSVVLAPRRKSREELWAYLVHQEASEVAAACKMNTSGLGILDQPEQVAECFLYMLDLCCRGSQFAGYDVATHGTSYWICNKDDADADADGLWRAADALQRELRLDVDYHQYLPSSPLAWSVESKPYWSSPTHGFTRILAGATPNGDMFQHYSDKLSVLKLSRCSFSFHSPPFLFCHSLRFLWFHHCQDTGISAGEGHPRGKEEDVRRCFQRLWVLDVRYTSCDQILSPQMLDLMTQLRELNVMGAQGWDMGQLQGRLPSLHKLRVTKSTIGCSCSEDDLFSEMNKVELLEFSGNDTVSLSRMRSLSGPGVSSCLDTVTVDESTGLERISFKGCTMLKNIFLRGWMGDIRMLDISGTAVKTLDLSSTVIRHLDELCLLDCEKLCAILWPEKDQMRDNLSILLLDTTAQSGSTSRSRIETMSPTAASAVARRGPPHSDEFPWYISVRDARLLVSLVPVYSTSRMTYVEVSSTSGGMRDDGIIKSGISSSVKLEASECNMMCEPGIMWMWPCPDAPDLSQQRCCYLHIQDQTRTKVPEFVIHCGKILHVHDGICGSVPSTTKYGSEWFNLEWCRIERCPISDCVFATGDAVGRIVFGYRLRTFWASQLSKALYIWKWSEPWGHTRRFPVLTLLHLDCCPRLIHVLPLSKPMIGDTIMARLETLEIVWCGDLREVFPLDVYAKSHVEREPLPVTLDFPGLKRIHLHELPKLQCICALRMSTPNLETIKIRACWSLTRLPIVRSNRTNKVVECDCEKEWCDRLEWDDASQARRYKMVHSPYYKKTLLRGTMLR